MGGVHVEVEQQRQLLQSSVAQQLRLIADEDGMLLLVFVQMHDGFRDLANEIAAIVSRFEIQLQGQLAEQIQGRSRGPVQIQDLIQVGIQARGKGARRGRFTRSHLAGQQAGPVMIGQELKARFDLLPGLRCKQLLAIGVVTEGVLFETEVGLYHGGSSSLFCFTSRSTKLIPVGSPWALSAGLVLGNWPFTTASTRRASPCGLPWK